MMWIGMMMEERRSGIKERLEPHSSTGGEVRRLTRRNAAIPASAISSRSSISVQSRHYYGTPGLERRRLRHQGESTNKSRRIESSAARRSSWDGVTVRCGSDGAGRWWGRVLVNKGDAKLKKGKEASNVGRERFHLSPAPRANTR